MGAAYYSQAHQSSASRHLRCHRRHCRHHHHRHHLHLRRPHRRHRRRHRRRRRRRRRPHHHWRSAARRASCYARFAGAAPTRSTTVRAAACTSTRRRAAAHRKTFRCQTSRPSCSGKVARTLCGMPSTSTCIRASVRHACYAARAPSRVGRRANPSWPTTALLPTLEPYAIAPAPRKPSHAPSMSPLALARMHWRASSVALVQPLRLATSTIEARDYMQWCRRSCAHERPLSQTPNLPHPTRPLWFSPQACIAPPGTVTQWSTPSY